MKIGNLLNKKKVPIASAVTESGTSSGKVIYNTTPCFGEMTQNEINELDGKELEAFITQANIDCNSGNFPNYTSKCCQPKQIKGGSINLTKEQAKQLIKQMGGNSIKSTYVSYNGKDAKILGYNRNMREFIVQSNTGLENISVDNLLLNGKRVL